MELRLIDLNDTFKKVIDEAPGIRLRVEELKLVKMGRAIGEKLEHLTAQDTGKLADLLKQAELVQKLRTIEDIKLLDDWEVI